MEIKAQLEKPYTEEQRIQFIVDFNHKLGYTIEETETHLNAMGYTEEEKQEQERERLDKLSMTRGDVFEALILAKGLGKAQIRAMMEQAELDDITKALYLNRFDEALEFYRGYPIFDMLGQALGFTSEMLDKFFDTKDYQYLTTCTLTVNVVPEEATVIINDVEQKQITVPYGAYVDVSVECEGYIGTAYTAFLTEDRTLDIELVKEVTDEDTTDTTQSDIQDELDTTASKSDETDTALEAWGYTKEERNEENSAADEVT